jgi:hypothetical protein
VLRRDSPAELVRAGGPQDEGTGGAETPHDLCVSSGRLAAEHQGAVRDWSAGDIEEFLHRDGDAVERATVSARFEFSIEGLGVFPRGRVQPREGPDCVVGLLDSSEAGGDESRHRHRPRPQAIAEVGQARPRCLRKSRSRHDVAVSISGTDM